MRKQQVCEEASWKKKKKAAEFFKILINADFKERLYLPPAFDPYISTQVLLRAQIKAYDGRNWSVELLRTDNYASFEAGWKEFVEYYNLQHGEILFFQYRGSLQFTVKIFDASALERPYEEVPLVETSKVTNREAHACNGRAQRKGSMRPKRSSLQNEPLSMERRTIDRPAFVNRSRMRNQKTQDSDVRSSISNRCNSTAVWRRRSIRVKRLSVQNEPDLGVKSSSCNFRRLNTDDADDFHKKDVCKPIRSVGDSSKLRNPSFKVVLKRIRINNIQWPHIPSVFYRTHLRGKEYIDISYANDELKRMWKVKLYARASGSRDITAGFLPFCYEYNLKAGDECTFVLNSERSSFTVYIVKDI